MTLPWKQEPFQPSSALLISPVKYQPDIPGPIPAQRSAVCWPNLGSFDQDLTRVREVKLPQLTSAALSWSEVQPLNSWLLHSAGCYRDRAHIPWWQLPWAAMFSSTLYWPPAISDWTMGIPTWGPPIHWPWIAEKDELGQIVSLSIRRGNYKTGPPIDELIKMVWYIQTMEYYSFIKQDKITPFAATWMELQIIAPSKVSQKEKDKCYMIWFTCGI